MKTLILFFALLLSCFAYAQTYEVVFEELTHYGAKGESIVDKRVPCPGLFVKIKDSETTISRNRLDITVIEVDSIGHYSNSISIDGITGFYITFSKPDPNEKNTVRTFFVKEPFVGQTYLVSSCAEYRVSNYSLIDRQFISYRLCYAINHIKITDSSIVASFLDKTVLIKITNPEPIKVFSQDSAHFSCPGWEGVDQDGRKVVFVKERRDYDKASPPASYFDCSIIYEDKMYILIAPIKPVPLLIDTNMY